MSRSENIHRGAHDAPPNSSNSVSQASSKARSGVPGHSSSLDTLPMTGDAFVRIPTIPKDPKDLSPTKSTSSQSNSSTPINNSPQFASSPISLNISVSPNKSYKDATMGFVVPSSQPDAANDDQVPLSQIGVFGNVPLTVTGFNSAHPPGHTAEMTGKRDPVNNSMSVSLLSSVAVSGTSQSKPIGSSLVSTLAGYPTQFVGDFVGGMPSNSVALSSAEQKSSQAKTTAQVSASNVLSVIRSEPKRARKNLLPDFNQSPTHPPLRPQEGKAAEGPDEDLDMDDVERSREEEKKRYKQATSWVNDNALLIPNITQIKVGASRAWLEGSLPSVEKQNSIVVDALKKVCARSFSEFSLRGRLLRKTKKRGCVTAAVFTGSVQQRIELQAVLSSFQISHEPLSPMMVEMECVLPAGTTDQRVASCIADAGLYGMVLYKRQTSRFFPKGSVRFFVPFNLFDELYKFERHMGTPIHWSKLEYNPTRCCNKCWQIGHAAGECKNNRRCFRCAGKCQSGNCTALQSRGLCEGDHIAPHCRKFYVRKRIPVIIPGDPTVSRVSVSSPSPAPAVSLTSAQSRPSVESQSEMKQMKEMLGLLVAVLAGLLPQAISPEIALRCQRLGINTSLASSQPSQPSQPAASSLSSPVSSVPAAVPSVPAAPAEKKKKEKEEDGSEQQQQQQQQQTTTTTTTTRARFLCRLFMICLLLNHCLFSNAARKPSHLSSLFGTNCC